MTNHRELRLPRAMQRWLPGYLRSLARPAPAGPPHLLVCLADHFEPRGCTISRDGSISGGADTTAARAFTAHWCEACTERLAGFCDTDGIPPRHTFFYPWDEYEEGILDRLAVFQAAGLGEIELHLHHRSDSAATLRARLEEGRDCLRQRHGLLGRHPDGTTGYAFVHGNWALCNGRPDGDWCGVRQEIDVLASTGCYADLTFPSAPSPTQPRVVNRLVYAADPAGRERGVQAGPVVGAAPADGRVMLINGPLGLNWRRRKGGLLPRLENAELSGINPPDDLRLRLWMRLAARVPARPDWIVLKLHTHGARPGNRDMLTGAPMAAFHRLLETGAKAGHWQHHYLSARELYNVILAGAGGATGAPGDYRDFRIRPPECCARP